MVNKILNHIIKKYTRSSLSYGDLLSIIHFCNGKNLIVELGTNIGTTAGILSMLCNKVISIDVFEDIDLIENERQREHYRQGFNANKHYFMHVKAWLINYKNIELIKSLTYKAAEKFKDDSIDAIFIDADHSYDGVKKDFESWYSKIKNNGIILFHDMIPNFNGTMLLYKELLNSKKVKEIRNPITEPTSIKVFKKGEPK